MLNEKPQVTPGGPILGTHKLEAVGMCLFFRQWYGADGPHARGLGDGHGLARMVGPANVVGDPRRQ
jgi:hypothetical protein